MATINKSITIIAPIEKIFKYTTEPSNLPEIWPSLVENKVVERLPNGGNAAQFVYKMAGMRFEGQAEWTEFVKDRRIVDKNEIGIPSTFVWVYEPEDGGTCYGDSGGPHFLGDSNKVASLTVTGDAWCRATDVT